MSQVVAWAPLVWARLSAHHPSSSSPLPACLVLLPLCPLVCVSVLAHALLSWVGLCGLCDIAKLGSLYQFPSFLFIYCYTSGYIHRRPPKTPWVKLVTWACEGGDLVAVQFIFKKTDCLPSQKQEEQDSVNTEGTSAEGERAWVLGARGLGESGALYLVPVSGQALRLSTSDHGNRVCMSLFLFCASASLRGVRPCTLGHFFRKGMYWRVNLRVSLTVVTHYELVDLHPSSFIHLLSIVMVIFIAAALTDYLVSLYRLKPPPGSWLIQRCWSFSGAMKQHQRSGPGHSALCRHSPAPSRDLLHPQEPRGDVVTQTLKSRFVEKVVILERCFPCDHSVYLQVKYNRIS